MKWFFVILLGAIAAGLPARAGADEFTILPAMAQAPDGCVGNPVTPLCTILTFEACHAWARRDFCRQVGYTTKYVRGGFAGFGALGIYKLRILDQWPLKQADIPDWKGNVGEWVKGGIEYETWRPGDLAVRLEFWECTPEDRCVTATRDHPTKQYGEGCPPDHSCTRPVPDFTYVLRKVGGNWQVLYEHFSEHDHGDFWDAFWKRR